MSSALNGLAEDSRSSSDSDAYDGDANGPRRNGKPSRAQKRKSKQKAKKLAEIDKQPPENRNAAAPVAGNENVEIEYVRAVPADVEHDPEFAQFISVFEKFAPREESKEEAAAVEEEKKHDKDEVTGKEEGGEGVMSRKAKKKLLQFEVATLKQSVKHPEVVEVHDVTAPDPQLLVYLKAYRNTVPVPRHWCHKRRYLAGKRGIDKGPFHLPEFITATGITKMRNADIEAQSEKTLKTKQRERYAPKLGKIDIDYEVLHDAFFKYQTKPKLTPFGDLYYEGKENEVKMFDKKPGVITDKLKKALGLADGHPPPWLLNMQRYGPPPSYPNLRIPGLNAPLPPGAAYGQKPGEWGKPPVDEYGRPLYGDVFGASEVAPQEELPVGGPATMVSGTGAVKFHWGELAPGAGEYYEEQDAGVVTSAPVEAAEAQPPLPADEPSGSASVSGTATPVDGALSTMTGIDTPQSLDIRKGSRAKGVSGLETPDAAALPELYTVLEQKSTSLQGGLLGTTHVYAMPGKDSKGVTVALTDDELQGLDEATLAKKYERGLAATKVAKEDYSDIVEEAERKRKRKEGAVSSASAKTKKAKEFKF